MKFKILLSALVVCVGLYWFSVLDNKKACTIEPGNYYDVCSTKTELESAFKAVKASGKPTIYEFGFYTCPYCRSMNFLFTDPESELLATCGDLVKSIIKIHIGVYNKAMPKGSPRPGGYFFAKELTAKLSEQPQFKGSPHFVFVKGEKVLSLNTGGLERKKENFKKDEEKGLWHLHRASAICKSLKEFFSE